MVNAVKVFTLRLCISAYYIHFKRVKVKIFTAFTIFVTKPKKFNYSTTIEAIRDFLSAHPVPEGKKYALVMDNAPWHKKTKRLICDECLPEYADILKNVVFIKLPPYSPDLNPIEQVWRITRRENTHNTFFASISILEMTIDESFNSWAAPNDQLKSLCSFK